MSGATRFQDRIAQGLGAAALRLGVAHTAYRPRGGPSPVAESNRFLHLPAWFDPELRHARLLPGWAGLCWSGVFDCAYTKPGDYLVGQSATFFVASQEPLQPVVCVRTNRVITVLRAPADRRPGMAQYGGKGHGPVVPFLSDWPVSLLMLSTGRRSLARLPGDGTAAQCQMLLPPLPNADLGIEATDQVVDDRGISYVVDAVEETSLGWRVALRIATS